MRLLLGIIIGAGLTIGGAYVHEFGRALTQIGRLNWKWL